MRSADFSKLLSLLITLTLSIMVASSSFAAITTATIRGTVKNQETGTPLKSALVELLKPGVAEPVDYTSTDASGTYTFTGVTPGTYDLSVTSQSFQNASTPITVVQEQTIDQDFNLVLKTTNGTRSSKLLVSPIPRSRTSTTYTQTKQDEQEREPNPTSSYQFPGLVLGVPGVTFDPSGGYVHLRGSDENEVGFQVDGISNTDTLENQFSTNIVSVGLKDANVELGGQDSSIGGNVGGAINEITKDGRDLVSKGKSIGGNVSFEAGPGRGWNYTGSDDEIGGVIGDKFDYYLSTVVFRNRFPENYNGLYNLPDSYDGLFKINYYADKNNKFTAYYGKGNEEYETMNDQEPVQFQPDQNNFVDTGKPNFKTHSMQSYQNYYFAFQHKFNNKSFVQYKLDNIPSKLQYYLGDAAEYESFGNNKVVNDLSYHNQLSKQFLLNVGDQYTPESDSLRLIFSSEAGPYASDTELQDAAGADPSVFGYLEEDTRMKVNRNALYIDTQYKPMGDKLTLTGGVRNESLQYNPNRESKFTKNTYDPRVGAAYSPTTDLVFHTSYGLTAQFAGARYIELGGPAAVGFPATSNDPAAQNAATELFSTPTKPNPTTSYNADFGIDKAFTVTNSGVLGGTYSFGAVAFQRVQKNNLERLNSTFTGSTDAGFNLGGPRQYLSEGHGHDAGIEFDLSKRSRGDSDQSFNGTLTYTNETARTTDSFFDTAYYPYFYNAFRRVPGLTKEAFAAGLGSEYAPTWDQKHTVYALLNKRVGKVVNFHLSMDAGSGYPYVIGISNLGIAGAGIAPGIDAQHVGSFHGVFNTTPVVLPNQNELQPLNPTPGRTGWHYKLTLNTDFAVTPTTTFFINADNIFDRKTVLIYSPVDAFGNQYYSQPTFAHPQGKVYYGPSTVLLPVFVSFGIRQKF